MFFSIQCSHECGITLRHAFLHACLFQLWFLCGGENWVRQIFFLILVACRKVLKKIFTEVNVLSCVLPLLKLFQFFLQK